MKTLSQVMATLFARGYIKDFQIKGNGIACSDGTALSTNEFRINKTYRFEGMSDPGDNAILYAITDLNDEPLGLLVDAYGVYSDDISSAMKQKLTESEKQINSAVDEEE